MSFLNEIEGTLRNVSKRFLALSDKVMLRYTKGINYDLNRVGLQYYMNNNVGIITEVEDDGVYNIKLEMQWKF